MGKRERRPLRTSPLRLLQVAQADQRPAHSCLVFAAGAGPVGTVLVEKVLVVDEVFKVALEQTDGSRTCPVLSYRPLQSAHPFLRLDFIISLFSPSSPPPSSDSASSSSSDFSFTFPAPLPSPVTEFLDAVKRCQATAVEKKWNAAEQETKRWDWVKKYAPGAPGRADEAKKGSRRLSSGFEGSLGAAYGARRTSGAVFSFFQPLNL